MRRDKRKHIGAGALIAIIASVALIVFGWYDRIIPIGNLPFPTYAIPMVLVIIAAVGREKWKPPFSLQDVLATMLGGMIGSAFSYSIWFYLLQSGAAS